MVTLAVATPTMPGAALVTLNVIPPADAGCVSVIGRDAVPPYGTFSGGGHETMLTTIWMLAVAVAPLEFVTVAVIVWRPPPSVGEMLAPVPRLPLTWLD